MGSHILDCIAEHKNITVREIACQLNVNKEICESFIKKLINAGIVMEQEQKGANLI